jgi:membrane associated rhomboid family serine protease
MNKSIWYDLKLKFFKSGRPVMFYIVLNVAVFIIISLITAISSNMGYGDLFEMLVEYHLAFPSSVYLWLPHFYTLLTHQFIEVSFFHLLFNMLWLYLMGQLLMDFIKSRQFHFIYLLGGIAGALFFGAYNLIPQATPSAANATLMGASAAVMAIFAALTTLVPNYSLRLMFVGNIKVKYLFLFYLIPDIIGISQGNVAISISHFGGALFGFAYVKTLQNGTDLSAILKKKPKLKVVKNENPKPGKNVVNQKEIDAILDKISKAGYDQLSKDEKETLFKASKN